MIDTIAPELDQMVTRKPKVRIPPLFCCDRAVIASWTICTTLRGANLAMLVTTVSIIPWRGKKLAMAMTKRSAGNSAKKK
jgi:hypothetical protein